jgi:hypothetical protein
MTNDREKMFRFRVTAMVGDLGVRSHIITARNPQAARARFRAAYPDHELFGVRTMKPEEIEAHQEEVFARWQAEQSARRAGGAA